MSNNICILECPKKIKYYIETEKNYQTAHKNGVNNYNYILLGQHLNKKSGQSRFFHYFLPYFLLNLSILPAVSTNIF